MCQAWPTRFDGPWTNNVPTRSERSLIYLDTSALVKVVIEEAESGALREWMATRPDRVSSLLTAVEMRRAARRAPSDRSRGRAADLGRETEVVLSGLQLLSLDEEIARRAAILDPPNLRSLDAIHIATALSLADLGDFVTYDTRLAAAARTAGLQVQSPGT